MTREEIKKALRHTTVTITLSVCAMIMGVALLVMSWLQEQKVSIVAIIIIAGMGLNMVPPFKRRHALQDELENMPKKR